MSNQEQEGEHDCQRRVKVGACSMGSFDLCEAPVVIAAIFTLFFKTISNKHLPFTILPLLPLRITIDSLPLGHTAAIWQVAVSPVRLSFSRIFPTVGFFIPWVISPIVAS